MFSGDEPFPPGSEPGELGELRGRLLFLLETSKHYQAQHLLTHFPESRLTISSIIVTSLITESGIRPGVVVKFSLSKCCLSWLMCIKGFVYPLSHDCHQDNDRDVLTACCRLSGDIVDLMSRAVCITVVASDWCITKLAHPLCS